MADDSNDSKSRRVPSGRMSRFGQFGRLAGGVAGGMVAEGARRLASGERPALRDMMLTRAMSPGLLIACRICAGRR